MPLSSVKTATRNKTRPLVSLPFILQKKNLAALNSLLVINSFARQCHGVIRRCRALRRHRTKARFLFLYTHTHTYIHTIAVAKGKCIARASTRQMVDSWCVARKKSFSSRVARPLHKWFVSRSILTLERFSCHRFGYASAANRSETRRFAGAQRFECYSSAVCNGDGVRKRVARIDDFWSWWCGFEFWKCVFSAVY